MIWYYEVYSKPIHTDKIMQYYVIDTTLTPPQDKRFNSYPSLVQYLEQMTIREFKQTRKQRMLLIEELGHGYDDSDSVTFTRSMAEKFNMGVIRRGGPTEERIRCDVTAEALFHKEEFGS